MLSQVPALGPAYELHSLRLDELEILCLGMHDDEQAHFEALLIGSLSAALTNEQWASCVSTSIALFNAGVNKRLKAAAEANTAPLVP